MKAAFKFLAPVAVATLALVSCQKETDVQVAENSGAVHITVKAAANDLLGETRTYIDDTKTIIWGTGEYMKIAVTGKNADDAITTAFANSSPDYADEWQGSAEAYFGFTLQNPPVQGVEGKYLHQGLYPASAAVSSSNTNPESYKVNLLSAQNASASSYDPAAYIMVAKPESFDEIQEEWTASYRRATALNKVTLKNFTDVVKSVKFILPEGKALTGRRHINLSTGESDDIYDGSNEVEVFFATPLQDTDNAGIPVWFTSWESKVASGEQMTIEVYTADKVYSKTITAGTNGISFKEGFLNTLSINMQGIEGQSLEDFSGDYLIGAMRDGTWNLMSSTNPGSYFNLTSTSVTTAPNNVVYTDFAYAVDVNAYIWRVAQDDNGYYIKNLVNSNYLAIKNDSNEARSAQSLTDEGLYPYFTISVNEGIATITSTKYTSRVLYGNAGSSRFAFYTSQGSMQSVYLIPATLDERAAVSLTFAEATVNKTGDDYSDFVGQTVTADPNVQAITNNIVYTMAGDEIGTIVSSSGAVTLNGNSGTATVTATFAGDETYRNAKASYIINVISSTGGPQYVQITSLENVTAGTYVIVNDGYYLPNAPATNAGPVKNDDTKVTVVDGKVVNVTDAMTWEFSGTTSAMTIKSTIAGNYYLVVSGNGNSNLRVNTTADNTWTIATNGTGTFSLKDDTYNRYCASYSAGSDWRSYDSPTASNYGDGGKIYLYKLTSGGEGGEGGDEKTTVYTLETITVSGNSDYTKTYDVTVNDITWSASGVNMTTAGCWRIGGKSLDKVDRIIYSKNAIVGDVNEIVIKTNGVSSNSFVVNSITVSAHATAALAASGNDSNAVQFETTFDCSTFPKGSATEVTFTKVGTTNCSDYYYRIVFNVTNSNTSNYGLDVNEVVFYNN